VRITPNKGFVTTLAASFRLTKTAVLTVRQNGYNKNIRRTDYD
jgi:hypothetical protein